MFYAMRWKVIEYIDNIKVMIKDFDIFLILIMITFTYMRMH